MAAVKDLLKAEVDGTLSFGDYTLENKMCIRDRKNRMIHT